MRWLILVVLWPLPALACGAPICVVDPAALELPRLITFDDQPSGWDPGHRVDERLVLNGASFAERFAGQDLGDDGGFDTVSGAALAPLTLLPGAPGQSLSVVNLMNTNMLNGFGPSGFPRPDAQGEGAIAVLFDSDQSALSFEILGGEAGTAQVQFLARDGAVIDVVTLVDLARGTVGFLRAGGAADIAGFVLTNTDPQGLAIDNLRFGAPFLLG